MQRRAILLIFLALLAGGGVYAWIFLNSGGGGTEKLGFINGVTTNGNYGIVFDEVEWLTGEEGENAAIEAGLCTEETRVTCLSNDFIINNPSEATQNFEFATGIVITMQTLNMEQNGVRDREITREEFEELLNDSRAHWRNLPYRITVKSGLVTSIAEVYVP